MADFGPPEPITQQDLLDLVERNFEDHWISALLADPSALSVFVGWAAAALRLQTAVDENFSVGAHVLSAPGRARASSVVRLSRPSGAEVTITTGHRFVDHRGAFWRPISDVVVAVSGVPQVADVPVQTERAGYWLNTFEAPAFQAYDDLPDSTFSVVAGPSAATGGKTPFLDQHGSERNMARAPGESDSHYAARMVFLVNQVSPKAIADTALEVLDGFAASRTVADLVVSHGLRAVREPFRESAQPAQRGLTGAESPFADDAFADDTSGHILRDETDYLAFFDVLLPTFADPGEARLFFDDGYFDDPSFGFPDLGPGDALVQPIAALADELDRRRAAGVRFRILQGVDVSLLRHPAGSGLVQAGDWLTETGLATEAGLVAALGDYDGDTRYARSAQGRGAGGALTAGDLLFTFPDVPDPVAIRRVVLRARVRMASVGAGVNPQIAFLVRPATTGAAVRALVGGYPLVVDHSGYREYTLILEQNPVTLAAWVLADVAGAFQAGIANAAAAGATEHLRVSEFTVELVASYG